LVSSAELTPVRIILGHCTPVLPVCPCTAGENPAGRDIPGYELSRMIYGHSIWSGDSSAACAEQNSLANTRGNGNVADKLRMVMMMTLPVEMRSGNLEMV